jgi:hypothetical protein
MLPAISADIRISTTLLHFCIFFSFEIKGNSEHFYLSEPYQSHYNSKLKKVKDNSTKEKPQLRKSRGLFYAVQTECWSCRLTIRWWAALKQVVDQEDHVGQFTSRVAVEVTGLQGIGSGAVLVQVVDQVNRIPDVYYVIVIAVAANVSGHGERL